MSEILNQITLHTNSLLDCFKRNRAIKNHRDRTMPQGKVLSPFFLVFWKFDKTKATDQTTQDTTQATQAITQATVEESFLQTFQGLHKDK